ncbi:MAG: arginine--tRNA ligase [Lactobacillaceae bacterium]|jgi:arginyl-tRNA synthetase|nr:arginine--tRNA ligase [Lactobacillaceae bacterium]
MQITDQITELLTKKVSPDLERRQIQAMIERPKQIENGDFSFPVFQLAKIRHQNPAEIAQNLAAEIQDPLFEKVEAKGPYLNFFLNRKDASSELFSQIDQALGDYGFNNDGQDKEVVIDMSSPNIAKPMSMGHLRSTVIGNTLSNLAKANGYHVDKVNHLGDWGTQFGLMIAAYKMWGDKPIQDYSIDELVKLYVRINQAAKEDESVADEGRRWFKMLEDGDQEALDLWKIISESSLKEFTDIYERLEIDFDAYTGESFYNDKMDAVIDLLKDKNLITVSQGAEIVDLPTLLPDSNLPIAMIRRSDGATLYMTRDLATAIYRKDHYHFDQSLYVVGAEQREHFAQLKAILKLAGFAWSDEMEHVSFGLITFNGSKMSSRKGNVVPLVDVLNSASQLALEQIEQKNPDLSNKKEVAEAVGVGAVIFNDLENDRNLTIDFDINEIVRFEGDTGPYVQYANARIHSILRKAGSFNLEGGLSDDQSWEVVSKMLDYPNIVKRAFDQRDPSIVAKYLLSLSRQFNSYYANTKILVEDDGLNARLTLIKSVSTILESGLALLGVKAPQEM